MKTPLFFALGSALCLVLAACTVTSDNPLSSPETAHADQRLVGDWYGKKEQNIIHFTATHGGWMHVVVTPKKPNVASKPGKRNPKPEEYDLFPTVIGNNTFLNVVAKDDESASTKSYYLLRYTVSGNHVLQMWMINQDAAATAVRAGKLKGIIHENKNLMLGHPPHPDVDVTLQGTTAQLARFIQGTDAAALFSDKMEPLTRIKTADR